MGDSTLIVTETDSVYLQNMVLDIQGNSLGNLSSTIKNEGATTLLNVEESPTASKESEASNKAITKSSDFEIDYGTFKVVIQNVEAKEFKKQNPSADPGVSYMITKGNLNQSQLIISGVQSLQIEQRYQSNLELVDGSQTLSLKSLGTFTSNWEKIQPTKKGEQFVLSLNGLANLSFSNINNASLKNGVQKQLKANRANTQTVQEWNKKIARVKSFKDAPCKVVLNNVQWRMTGKDSKGNNFTKLIRIDSN